MRPRTFLPHHFERIAYSHISAYLGMYNNIVLITCVHGIFHKASYSTQNEWWLLYKLLFTISFSSLMWPIFCALRNKKTKKGSLPCECCQSTDHFNICLSDKARKARTEYLVDMEGQRGSYTCVLAEEWVTCGLNSLHWFRVPHLLLLRPSSYPFYIKTQLLSEAGP